MNNEMLYETIFTRRSIRKYDSAPLDEKTLALVLDQLAALRPMLPDIKTEFRFLGIDEVKGMFKADAPHYLAIYSEEKKGCAANAGFLLEQMDLFFSASGIGSCWLGGSKPTKKAAPVGGKEYVILLAFGKPTEELRRKSVAEFKRKPLTDISDVKGAEELMEAVRIAPSAMNNQSWYYRGDASKIDAYYARSMLTDQMNQINVGIGMCCLWLSALHRKRSIDLIADITSEERAPKGYRYVISAKME